MKILVIGYGSIGKRHARLLAAKKHEIAIVSSQQTEYSRFTSIDRALKEFAPKRVVICSVTSDHAKHLNALAKAKFAGEVLVEKPLFKHAAEGKESYPFNIRVAYQMRFHPVILALKAELASRPVLSAQAYVGQHLSQWRPERDAKETYSAHRAQGGGVMRDLSHELDLALHLFGPAQAWHGFAARTSDVTVDSEDAAALILHCARCPVVSLAMNYLDHTPKREWIINTADAALKADLIANTLTVNGKTHAVACAPDDPYIAMHAAWLKDKSDLCSYEEGLALAEMIDTVAP